MSEPEATTVEIFHELWRRQVKEETRRAESLKGNDPFPDVSFWFFSSARSLRTDIRDGSASRREKREQRPVAGAVRAGWSVRRMSRYCSNRFALLTAALGNEWSLTDTLRT